MQQLQCRRTYLPLMHSGCPGPRSQPNVIAKVSALPVGRPYALLGIYSAVPADDGVWLDDDQDIRPARPQPRESEPEGRSILRRRGRPEVRRRLASCWRRARFSSARSARVRKAERNVLMRLKSRSTIVKQCRESAVTARPTCRSAPPSENGQRGCLPGEPQPLPYTPD